MSTKLVRTLGVLLQVEGDSTFIAQVNSSIIRIDIGTVLTVDKVPAAKIIKTENAPAPLACYSQAVRANHMVFVGGQLGLVPGSGKLISGDVVEQVKQAFKNMTAILEEAGAGLDGVVKTTVLLTDMEDAKAVNDIYKTIFEDDGPARVMLAAKTLPLNARVEIDAFAVVKSD